MRLPRLPDAATVAGLLVVWAVPWSVAPGRVAEDTKNDLYVDPWGFLARAWSLWDSQVTWGGLANQGYGYLFPMGPFFGIGSELAPVWVVQRLWWCVLLTAGFLGALGLLRALDVGTPRVRVVGALTYVLAPRVLSSVAGLSAEAQPQLLAPLAVLPLVLAHAGRLSTSRAVVLSGAAVLCMGGVNATATLFGVLPAGLWLLTRRGWWRSRLTWTWPLAVLAATSWWLVPLLVMGRYAPPFLSWIEDAEVVTRQLTLNDILRGTTHWLGHVVTPGGAWWPAGHELVVMPVLIVLSTTVAALAIAGLASPAARERRWTWTMLVVGVVLLSIGHAGPLSSPFDGAARTALDGPLAPLRNIHKVDLLVRLSVMLGLTHLLAQLTVWRPRRSWLSPAAVAVASVIVVGAAAPGFTGAVAVRGSFEKMPDHWVAAGAWLSEHEAEGGSLLVPAANFGEYTWGRTIDEPLRPLTSAPFAVRDAVPLAPAGTIRLLDGVERRLQGGRSLEGTTDALLGAGVRYLVVRNDLDVGQSGQPPVALARSAVRSTEGVSLATGFGPSFLDASGARVRPVEIYALPGDAAAPLQSWPADAVVGASGASENLLDLADAGLLDAPVIFDGDRQDALEPGRRVETDGFRARQRWYGAARGADLSPTLTREEVVGTPDYRPWADAELMSTRTYSGIRGVTASSSVATDLTFLGLRPAWRPASAVDGDARTAWMTMWDERPRLTIDLLPGSRVDHVYVTGLQDVPRGDGAPKTPSRIEVSTGDGAVEADISPGRTRVELPPGEQERLVVTILEVGGESPGTEVTGLAEVEIPGVEVRQEIQSPEPRGDEPTAGIVLSAGLPGRDGCTSAMSGHVCFAGDRVAPEETGAQVRRVPGVRSGSWHLSGTLVPSGTGVSGLTGSPDVRVSASSRRSLAPAVGPESLVDGDRKTAWSPAYGDRSPSLTLQLDRPRTIRDLRIDTRGGWSWDGTALVRVEIGDEEHLRPVRDGVVTIPPTTGDELRLTFSSPPRERGELTTFAAMEITEITLDGAPFAPPKDRVEAPCGDGPDVRVDGQLVETSASVDRDALLGSGTARWTACETVRTGSGGDLVVEVEPWREFSAGTTVLEAARAPRLVTGPTDLRAAGGAGPWTAALTPAPDERLVVMDQNENDGWRAALDGRQLTPQVVDGRRQGFIVPAGAEGTLMIDFAPVGAYRAGLVVGGAMAVLLALGAMLALVRPSPAPVRQTRPEVGRRARRRTTVVARAVGAGAVGALLAGPAGAALGVTGYVIGRAASRRSRSWVPAVVATLVVGSGAVLAVLAPGSSGGPVLEGSTRVVLLLALGLAAGGAAGHHLGDGPRGRSLDDLVGQRGQRERDRYPQGEERKDASGERCDPADGVEGMEDR